MSRVRSFRARRSEIFSADLSFDRLETRRALAGIQYNPQTRKIEIDGSSAADRALVSLVGSATIRVELVGVATLDFARSSLNGVVFWGRSGDDFFQNATSLPSFAYGHAGADVFHGGSGNDNFQGGSGNDTLNGNAGLDQLRGNEEQDILRGGDGNDWLLGGSGDDSLDGQNGNDLLHGEDGHDLLMGNGGHDQLFGSDGNDRLFGHDGNDRLDGEIGDDFLDAGTGMDQVWGGPGNDSLFGGNEADSLWGGDGDDLLEGGLANDQLRGENGNDRLYGQAGNDSLFGGNGIDGLFGGIGGLDRLQGDAGADRFLSWGQPVLLDFSSSDGQLKFVNRTGSWSEIEIKVLDEGLHSLHVRVGTARILRDSLDTDPVIYSKWNSLGGALSSNSLKKTVTQGVTRYDRELKFADWNELSESANSLLRYTAIHEIGHSWDSVEEINSRLPGHGNLWNSFLALSGWRNTNPNNAAYARSLDGEWWYLKSAPFVRQYSRNNPREDWSTVWEIYFDPTRADDRQRVQTKINLVSQFFDLL